MLPATIALAIFTPLLLPSSADAHLVTTGLGPFYDGAMHLLLSPSDLLGLLASVLLAGLHGARAARWAVLTLPLTWLTAGIVGLNLPIAVDLPLLSVLSFVLLGALVAVNPRLPAGMVAALAGLYGALHGLLNGSALTAIGAGPLTLSGIAVTVFVFALLCAAGAASLKAAWTRIALRVAGSWVAAIGMLMLGWLVRGTG